MVAVIHEAISLRRVLNYNENKVKEGVALCLDAPYYLKDADQLTFDQKLSRLTNLASLNEETGLNAIHISLNFDPSEQLSHEKLKAIAADYMEKIGFAGQPYLLYQHHDAGHPHVHLLTTNIKPDGKRISTHLLGARQSTVARKALEIEYGLVQAESKTKRMKYDLKPISIKAEYGKASTKRAITNILNVVLRDYKFTSLPELNAVLNLYNVSAERGSEDSRTYKTNGLIYRIKTEDGTLIGAPIKASLIFGEPTLKNIQALFPENEKARKNFKKYIRNAIDLALLDKRINNLSLLKTELEKSGIDLVLRKNKEGIVYGLTYVDHKNSCVFNGRTLGADYSASAIQQRFGITQQPVLAHERVSLSLPKQEFHTEQIRIGTTLSASTDGIAPGKENQLLDLLMRAEHDSSYLPPELSGKKKKKKKQHRHNL